MSVIKFESKDKLTLLAVAACQVTIAWIMMFFELVYAPLPMFGAAVVAGFLFKGRHRQASVIGALAGVIGGFFSEYAYHLVRIKNVVSWSQLTAIEQFWLAIAEMLLYASLLSFFAAFFSWGTHHEYSNSVKTVPIIKEKAEDPLPYVDIPMFKSEDQKVSNSPDISITKEDKE